MRQFVLVSYGLLVSALPLLIDRAAEVVEAVKPRRLGENCALGATGERRIHLLDKKSRTDWERHASVQ